MKGAFGPVRGIGAGRVWGCGGENAMPSFSLFPELGWLGTAFYGTIIVAFKIWSVENWFGPVNFFLS